MNKLFKMIGGYYPQIHKHKNNTTIIVLAVILFLFCITFLFSSCLCSIVQMSNSSSSDAPITKIYPNKPSNNIIGNDTDSYGCNRSAGYNYCKSKGQCIGPTEHCPSPSHSPSHSPSPNTTKHSDY